MKLLYALVATAILVLGTVHMATTFRLSSSPAAKLWFFGAGIAIALSGVLNFLNRRYGLAAFGLRAACIATNLLMVCFGAIAGRVTASSGAAQAVMLTLLTSALVLSALRSASISSPEART